MLRFVLCVAAFAAVSRATFVDVESVAQTTTAAAETTTEAVVETSTADPSEFGSVASRCNATERAFWTGNAEFTREYQLSSARSFGSSDGTTEGLVAAFGQHGSRECFSCLGDATECGRNNCFLVCLINQQSPACQSCINTHCRPALIACTGAESLEELPAPPTQPLTTEPTTKRPLRTRPAPLTTAAPADTESNTAEETTTEGTIEEIARDDRAVRRRADDKTDIITALARFVGLILLILAAWLASRLHGGQ